MKQFRPLASKDVKNCTLKKDLRPCPYVSVLSSEDCEVSFIEVALRIAINMIPYAVVWSVFLQYAHAAGLESGMPSKQFRAGSLTPEAHGLWVS